MMAYQEPITGTGLRTPRAAAAAGIVFSLLLGLALVFSRIISVPVLIATEGAWLTDTSQRATIALALNLVPFAGIAFLWFIGVVRDRIGQREDRFFASVFLGSGLLFVAMLFIGAAFAGGLIASVPGRSAVPGPGTLVISRQVTGLLLRVYAMRMAAVFTISTATITLRTKVIPRWIGMLGFAVAAVLLVSVGLTPWVELLFPAWILLLSIDILRTGLRAPAARAARPSAHSHDRASRGLPAVSGRVSAWCVPGRRGLLRGRPGGGPGRQLAHPVAAPEAPRPAQAWGTAARHGTRPPARTRVCRPSS